MNGLLPFYGPFGDIKDTVPASTSPLGLPARLRRRLVRCTPANRHREEGLLAPGRRGAVRQEVLEAIPDGRGVHMNDGKMQDDATWKQCKVMVSLAEMHGGEGPGAERGVRVLVADLGSADADRARIRCNRAGGHPGERCAPGRHSAPAGPSRPADANGRRGRDGAGRWPASASACSTPRARRCSAGSSNGRPEAPSRGSARRSPI